MKNYTTILIALYMCSQANAQWSLTGNTGTNPATNFLGTKDNQPLRIRVNNIWAGEVNPSTGNIFLGLKSGMSNTTGYSNIAIGNGALRLNAVQHNMVAIGDSALFNATTISTGNNTAIGSKALYANTGGFNNTAVGFQSMMSTTSGEMNVAVGAQSLNVNTTGGYNAAIGHFAMLNNTSGNNNTGMGWCAMYSNTTGIINTSIGAAAMYENTTGNYNTAIGADALFHNTYGYFNTAVGNGALINTTGAQYNTTVGYSAGSKYDLGYNNTILGANCDAAFAGCYNDISIGQGVTCTDNSMARIGNTATWSIGGYAGWTQLSDGRFKKDIQENVKGLEFIMKLRPVTYHVNVSAVSKQVKENQGQEWNAQMKTAIADKEKVLETGFIAQEVEQAAKDAGFDFNGVDRPRTDSGVYGLRYAAFVVPLVKAMQEQQAVIKDLQSKVDQLQQQADIAILLHETFAADKISAYPDPVVSTMTVTINTQQAGNGRLNIYDSGGKLVKQLGIDVLIGANTINLSLPGLAAGYYTLKMDWGTNMHKQISFIKTNQ